ncbi:DUF5134 domain-containing protein [Streptomyces naganishii]|uniref:DUF5134 domain-containing protein n=1 Tax=Streptomyces naganishii JCM 4654 TaxID=1306179 RepID=A0A918Y162_9ACTN|nr:DUF5134 domain-containing protein [Streptomyces naganishii]GHD86252.1 DUF5134 domain-containing protein [Streptomyces naganishii JCM 4654]
MHGPASPGWLLVALCAATGAYCLLRMRSSVEEQRRAAGGEALMGFGMAAMAVPAAAFTPPAWAWPAYAVVFGAAALRALWSSRALWSPSALWSPRALWSSRASAHHLHHLIGATAMVYMAVVMAASPAAHHHAHGASGVPLVTGALLLYFVAYVLLTGTRLVPAGPVPAGTGPAGGSAPGGSPGWGDRPELARACRLSMGMAMVAMLLGL